MSFFAGILYMNGCNIYTVVLFTDFVSFRIGKENHPWKNLEQVGRNILFCIHMALYFADWIFIYSSGRCQLVIFGLGIASYHL